MSFWTTQINLRKPLHRMIGALIGGSVVKLTGIFVFPAVFFWIDWQPSLPGWLFIPICLGIWYVPLYFMVWIYWGLSPTRKTTVWSRNAMLLAATAGVVIDVGFTVLFNVVLANTQGFFGGATLLVVFVGPLIPAGIVTFWLFGRLKPAGEGPIARRRRRERVTAGLCGTCGYDLRGTTGGVCSECGGELTKGRAC